MNIFLLTESEKYNRFTRIFEEFKKRGINPSTVLIYQQLMSNEELLFSDIKKEDIFWLTSNARIGHKIFRNYLTGENFIWPSHEVLNFCDKFYTSIFFYKNKILTPKTFLVNSSDLFDKLKNKIKFPCVIKRTNYSHGEGIGIINSCEEISYFIKQNIKETSERPFLFSRSAFFILQEYIAESKGSDYRVLCLDGEILGGIKRTSQTDDFRANVSLGGKAEAFDVPEDLAKICKKIIKEGKLFYAGLDFIKSNRGWMAIEINTCAQFQGFEKATGINVAGKIVEALIKKSKNR